MSLVHPVGVPSRERHRLLGTWALEVSVPRRTPSSTAGLRALRALVAAQRAHASGRAGGWALSAATETGPPAAGVPGDSGSGSGSGGHPLSTAEHAQRTRMQALVTLAQRGDGEAFAEIYDHYVDGVYRYVFYRMGSHAVAEDLTSETFLRALRSLDSFSWQGRDIGAWFTTIARNLIADHTKSSRFRLEVPTADMRDADRADGDVEGEALRSLQNSELLVAMKQLKTEQQECLVLRFLQDLSVAETAEVMRRSEGAIKQLQLRAVRALAKILEGAA